MDGVVYKQKEKDEWFVKRRGSSWVLTDHYSARKLLRTSVTLMDL